MALPDPQKIKAAPSRRRERSWRALCILAPVTVGAAVMLGIVELAAGEPLVAQGPTSAAIVVAGFLVLAWLVMSVERRLLQHLESIQGAQYRDGYAAGYVDAAARYRGGPMERPSLRPVN
jgi:hypothetical protein